MASNEDFYTRPSPRPLSLTQPPVSPFTPDTPPPPPPKPGSQDTSGQGTPQIPPSPLTHTQLIRPPALVPNLPSDTPRPLPPTPSTSSQPTNHVQADNSRDYVPSPQLPSSFIPDLVPSKSTADLAPILSDSVLLSALAATHPSHTESIAPVNQALETNLALAARTLTLQNHVTSLREQTQQLLLQHTTLSTQWRRKQAEMDRALEPWSPKAMYGRLVGGISEQEAIVRAIEESFLEAPGPEDHALGSVAGKAGEREVGEWIKRIREGVTVLERRKESRARWDEGRVGGWR